MSTITTNKRNRMGYLVFSWLGRLVYSLRLHLESLNDWVDLKAGQFLDED